MDQVTDNVIRVPHLLSVGQYAKAAGIQPRSVHLRIKRRVLASATVDGLHVIDSTASVPAKVLPRKMAKADALQWPAELPSPTRLIRVKNFCWQHNIRTDAIFTDILLGRLRAYCFADDVFVENTDAMHDYITHRKPRFLR